MAKKITVKSTNKINWLDFFEESDEAISAADLARQFNQKYGTRIHYNDMNAYLHRTFGIASTTGDENNFNMYAVKFKRSLPSAVIIGDFAGEEEEDHTPSAE